jgi:hypothetical protein
MYTRGVIFYEEDDDLDVVPKTKRWFLKGLWKRYALLSFLVVFWWTKKRERDLSFFVKRKDRSIDSKHFVGRGA